MRDEILALLEDGAHSARDLATWLERPKLAVSQELYVLRAAGRVRRLKTGHWALGTDDNTSRTQVPAPTAIGGQQALVLEAIRQGALTSYDVSKQTALSVKTSSAALSFLCAKDLIEKTGQVKFPGAARAVHTYRLTDRAGQACVRPSGDVKVAIATRALANQDRDIGIALRRRPAQPDTFKPSRGRGGRLARLRAAADIDVSLGIREASSGPAICLHCMKRFTPTREGEEYCTDRCHEQGPAWAPATRTLVVNGQEYEATSVGARPVTEWPTRDFGGSSLSGREMRLDVKR